MCTASGICPVVIEQNVLIRFDDPDLVVLRRELRKKMEYVRENPVRAGLVSRADDWPHRGEFVVIDQGLVFAAGTVASTEESSLARDLYRARVDSIVVALNGLGSERILLARA